jgi:hypothetical protein
MVPCKFLDLNTDEEIQDNTKKLSVAANDKPKKLLKHNTPSLDNYWLNEIKSQEDTARQIVTICILLLVASFTIIINNADRIFIFLNNTRPYVPGTASYDVASNIIPGIHLINIEAISFFSQIISIAGFFLIWILALKVAIRALKLEIINNNEHHSINLAYIAIIKQAHCESSVNIITCGMVFLSIFVTGFMMATINGESWLLLGTLIMTISMFGLFMIEIIIFYWYKKFYHKYCNNLYENLRRA